MQPLIQRLVELLQALQLGPRTQPDAIRDLLRAIAAQGIQDDAAQATPPAGDWPGEVLEALERGAADAADLDAKGLRLHIDAEVLPLASPSGQPTDNPTRTYGPFIDRDGRLVRFVAFESPALLSVVVRPLVAPDEVVLMVPIDSVPSADLRTWRLPAGTVWIRTRLLAAGAAGYAGLRIAAGGTLTFAGLSPITRQGTSIVAMMQPSFALSVQPEPAAAPEAGSDAAAVTLRLPDRLDVTSGAAPQVTGAVSVSGFGSALSFTPSGAAPFVTNGLCCFPLIPADPAWTIDGNRSALAQISGAVSVNAPAWALPVVSSLGAGAILAAPHGGSVTANVTGMLTSRFAGVGGRPFKWFVSTLVANAARVELDGLQVSPGGRGDVEFWSKARSSFVFHQQALNGLRFRSERGGQDAVAIRGGEQRNFWDLPRRSDARPFPFTGSIDTFGLIADADGAVLTSLAQTRNATDVSGMAIENLYVVVRQPKRCALAAAFEPATSTAPGGLARLFLDARFGVPMLPDPYASNIGVRDPGDTFADVLHLDLTWIWSQPPAVRAHLDGDLRLAASQSADPQQNGDLAIGMFRRTIDPFRRVPVVETMFLLDLSSREDLYGVAFEPLLPQPALPNEPPSIAGNQFAVPLNRVRLFMQPQVHWEPLWVQASPNVPQLAEGMVHSVLDSGVTLVGVGAVTTCVPAVPAIVTNRILEAIGNRQPAAAVFALPFGLRAMADLTRRLIERPADLALPSTQTSIHEPDFGRLHSARQIRLEARQLRIGILNAADPVMPGMLQQLENLDRAPIQNPPPAPPAPRSVLSELTLTLNGAFGSTLPLRQADLSGYGLSTFSEWSRDTQSGVTKVHFHVLNGRTAYEVIQVRSRLYECTAPVVRTITMARHNSASVVLTDSGWVPVDDGEFAAVDKAGGGTAPFANGVVRAYRRIRRITTTGRIVSIAAAGAVPAARFETVVFDADLEIDTKDGQTVTVPLLGRTGYVHLPEAGTPPVAEQVRSLFQQVGVISSPTNATVRIAKTLALHATSVAADAAPDDWQGVGFGVALVGNPELPRAGRWSVVKLDQATSAGLPIDQHRGVPLVQIGTGDVVFREPSEARRTRAILRYALMMSTPTSRALFPQPAVKPAAAGRLFCDAPSLADPYSLVQTNGVFPAATAALGLKTPASFAIAGDDWKIEQGPFGFDAPVGSLLDGGKWSIGRLYPGGTVNLALDSAANALWKVAAPPSDLNLRLPDPLGDILRITTEYLADSSGLPQLTKPKVDFIGPLNEVRDIIDALGHIVDTGFNVDVNVTAGGSASSPAFRVQLKMLLRIGSPEERIDIGVGKFFGQFILGGDLAIGTAGVSDPRLSLQFQGDVQQGIIPPLLYAGGLFRFGVTIPATGDPVIELALGVVASIGGDLIPGLLEVEVTVHYGYVLIPETLQPGVLLGLDARAKLLSGLVGFSFGVEAMGRIQRLSKDGVRVWAHIRVAATVQIAWLIEEDVDFETEFEQEIPLAIATLAGGGGLALAGLAAAVES